MVVRPPDEFGPDAEDGAYWGVSEVAYHSHPALSRSVVATYIDESPRHAQHRWDEPHEASEPGLGTTVHDRVLRPDMFKDRYAQAPETCEGTTSSGDPCSKSPQFRVGGSWRCRYHGDETDADDIYRLPDSRAETVAGVVEAIRDHSVAGPLLMEADETEVTLLWTDSDTGLRLRARLDAVHVFGGEEYDIADLKTCGSAHPKDIGQQLYKTGSWLQPAFYGRGVEVLSEGAPENFLFVCAETDAPYVVEVYRMDPVQVQRARQALGAALEGISEYVEEGRWPAYTGLHKSVDEVQVPHWATRRLDLPPVEVPQGEEETRNTGSTQTVPTP